MEQEISGAQDGLALPTLDKCKTLTKAQLKEANKAVEDASESEGVRRGESITGVGRRIGPTLENILQKMGLPEQPHIFSAHLRCNVRIMIRSSYKI